jgi:hypothetical protein
MLPHETRSKAASPERSEQKSTDLVKAEGEILRLHSQLRRAEEERDLLEAPRSALPRNPSEVPLHARTSRALCCSIDVRG